MSDAPQHIVKSFEAELTLLRDRISQMGGMVEHQVAAASRAVAEKDNVSASAAVEADPSVDAMEREIEQTVIRMLALRQPMAADLRQVVAALKMTSDLERIGDYASNIAKRSIVLSQFTMPFSLAGISAMARLVQENLKLVIDAAGDGDADKALTVWYADQGVDDIYNGIFRELITYMMEDPRSITPCTHLLFVAKNLERIGDHATNIAETVHYAATGEVMPDARPKGDNSAYAVVRQRES
jgi:phosphate transport system protein